MLSDKLGLSLRQHLLFIICISLYLYSFILLIVIQTMSHSLCVCSFIYLSLLFCFISSLFINLYYLLYRNSNHVPFNVFVISCFGRPRECVYLSLFGHCQLGLALYSTSRRRHVRTEYLHCHAVIIFAKRPWLFDIICHSLHPLQSIFT